MNELALFAGAGGGILASHLFGARTICAVECDEYAASVLVQRQNDGILPAFPIWDDIHTFDGTQWRGVVDLVSGGFPCQAFSTAAAGRNTARDLWPQMRRVIEEVGPKIVFAENVAKRAIEPAAEDLRSLGYETKAIQLSAADLGADHVRKRYWLLAYADDESELLCRFNAEMAGCTDIPPSVWATYPGEPRVVDGMAHRMDRLKATGNGQVASVAALAFVLLAREVSKT